MSPEPCPELIADPQIPKFYANDLRVFGTDIDITIVFRQACVDEDGCKIRELRCEITIPLRVASQLAYLLTKRSEPSAAFAPATSSDPLAPEPLYP